MADKLRQNNLTEKTAYADELIIADHNFAVSTMVENYALDLSFGDKDTSFEARFIYPHLKGGEFIYLDGTEYGGVIDSVKAVSNFPEVIYKGRTWHGILDSKIVESTNIDTTANTLIEEIIRDNKLSYIFRYIPNRQGDTKLSYKAEKDEPMSAYKLIRSALKQAGLKLCMKANSGHIDMWVDKVATIEDTLVSSVANFTAERALFIPNHLIAKGELKGEDKDSEPERLTLHLYADENGNISTTQTFTGAEEIQIYKSFSGMKHEKGENVSRELKEQLEEKATEELKKLQRFAKAETSVLGNSNWNVGDIVRVSDYNVGFDITTDITGKLVRVEQGVLTVDYSVGSETAKAEAIAIIEPPRPNKVFSWFPGDNYTAGDLWTNRDTGEVMLATGTSAGTYNPRDWVAVSNLSDDKLSQEALTMARGIRGDLKRVETDLGHAKTNISATSQKVRKVEGDLGAVRSDIAETTTKISAVEGDLGVTRTNLEKTTQDVKKVGMDVDQAKQDITSTAKRITSVQADVTSTQLGLNATNRKINNVSQDVADVRKDAQATAQEVTKVSEGVTQAQSDIAKTSSKVSKVEGDLGRTKSDLNKTSQKVVSVASDVDKVKQDLTKTAADVVRVDNKTGVVQAGVNIVNSMITTVSVKVDDVRKSAQETADEVVKVTETVTQAQSDIASTSKKVDDVQSEVAQAKVDLSKTNQKVTSVEGDISRVRTDVNRTAQKVNTVEGSVNKARADLNMTTQKVTAVEGNINQARADITKTSQKVSAVEGSIGKVASDVSKTSQKVSAVEQSVSDIKADVDSATDKITTVEGNVAQVQSDVDKTSKKVTTVEGNVSRVQADVNRTSQKVSAVEGNVNRVKADVTKTSQQVTKVAGDVSQAKADITKANEKVSAVEGDMSKAKADIIRLDGLIIQTSSDVQKVTSGLAETKVGLDRVDTLISDVDGKVSAVKTSADRANTTANNAISRISATDRAVSEADKKITGVKNDVASVRGDVAQANRSIAGVRSDISTARNDISSAKGDIASAGKKIGNVEQKLTTVETKADEAKRGSANAYSKAEQANTRANDAISKTNEVRGSLDNVKRVVTKVEQDVEDVTYSMLRADNVSRNAYNMITSLQAMPTLIRQDPSGIIVGKSVDNEYPENAVVTRQSSMGAFEICTIKNGKLVPVSTFTKDNITIGDEFSQSIKLGKLNIASKKVYLDGRNMDPNNPKNPITASSIRGEDVLAVAAANKTSSASLHLNAGTDVAGYVHGSNITLKADSISFMTPDTDGDSELMHGKLRALSTEKIAKTLGCHVYTEYSAVSHLRLYKYGPIVVVSANDIVEFSTVSYEWRYYWTIDNKAMWPRYDVVTRSTGFVNGNNGAIDMKIDTNGKVYFRQWSGNYGTIKFAPNFSYICQESAIDGELSHFDSMRG